MLELEPPRFASVRPHPTRAKLRWELDWLRPNIGSRPVEQIQPFEILAILLEAKVSKIPTARMRKRWERVVPLSTQAASSRAFAIEKRPSPLRLAYASLPRVSARGTIFFVRSATISTPIKASVAPAIICVSSLSPVSATPKAMVASGVISVSGDSRFAS